MDVFAALREQIALTRQLLGGTVEGLTQEQAQWQPAGTAHNVAATYAHVVLGEDAVVNGALQGKAPLFATSWAGRRGLSAMPPQETAEGIDWSNWARTVRVDLPALRQYAQAVYGATDAYLAGLKPEDLDRQVDGPIGRQSVQGLFYAVVILNANLHCGEIAAVKGLQGLKGYPF